MGRLGLDVRPFQNAGLSTRGLADFQVRRPEEQVPHSRDQGSANCLSVCRLHHRHDAGLDRLGQSGPGGHDGGQLGVILGGGRYYAYAGSATGSAHTPGRAGNGRVGTGWRDLMGLT